MATDKKRSAPVYTDTFQEVLDAQAAKKPKNEIVVTIIGLSSKRSVRFASDVCNVLTSNTFDLMVNHTISLIEDKFLISDDAEKTEREKLDWSNVKLMSGGASWCDHVAVRVFLLKRQNGARLSLMMPCEFKDGKFHDNHLPWSAQRNPGGIANVQHKEFSTSIGKSSLAEISLAVEGGANLDCSNFGFFVRDKILATKCDHMIAFGWSDAGEPDTPGTLHTWRAAPITVNKHYVSISKLVKSPVATSAN